MPAHWAARASWRRVLVNATISAVVVAPLLLPEPAGSARVGIIGIVVTLVPAAALWVRDRWPMLVLAVCLVCYGLGVLTMKLDVSAIMATAIALFAYAVRRDRARALIAAAATLAVVVPISVLGVSGQILDPLVIAIAVSVALAAALGDGTRSRRAYIAEIVARAESAEASRESEAARRVAEERLKLAQDLHDVVAHQITVISLHSGVASSLLQRDPAAARVAMTTVRDASRRVLTDTAGLLRVLRSEHPPLEPQPGLENLSSLMDEFADAGLHVALRRDGEPREVTPGVSLVAYRAVQEGLTNALRHGSDGRAHLLLVFEGQALRIVITNRTEGSLGGHAREHGSGYGLRGMAERVESVAGAAHFESKGGVFRLEVTLPTRGDA